MDSLQVAFFLNHRQQASFPDVTERIVPHGATNILRWLQRN